MKFILERRLTIKTTFSKEYKIFIFSLLISRIGDLLYTFARPWVAYQLTGSAIIMSSLFGPLVGVLIDTFEKSYYGRKDNYV